jgi:hypothetical protein
MQENERTVVIRDTTQLLSPATRRGFLRALSLGGTAVLLPSVFAACDDSFGSQVSTEVNDAFNASQAIVLNLSNDIGIFNFAFLLEQLEASFYEQALQSSAFAAMSAPERELLTDLRNDEVTHRQFLATALGSAAIRTASFNFAGRFASRDSILTTALALEQTGVGAYNGAGNNLRNVNNLLVAGKIVSVEARHAAAIADALDTTGVAFAELTRLAQFGAEDATARDNVLEAPQVLPIAAPFITNTVRIGVAPTEPAA